MAVPNKDLNTKGDLIYDLQKGLKMVELEIVSLHKCKAELTSSINKLVKTVDYYNASVKQSNTERELDREKDAAELKKFGELIRSVTDDLSLAIAVSKDGKTLFHIGKKISLFVFESSKIVAALGIFAGFIYGLYTQGISFFSIIFHFIIRFFAR